MTRDEFWEFMYPQVKVNVDQYGWDEALIPGIIAQAAGESGYGTGQTAVYYNYWGMTSGWSGADYYVDGWCAFYSKNSGIDFYFKKLQNSTIYAEAKDQTDPYEYVRYLSSQGWNEEGVDVYMETMTPIIEYYSGKEPPTPTPSITLAATMAILAGKVVKRRL